MVMAETMLMLRWSYRRGSNDVPMFKIERNMRKLCDFAIISYNLMTIFPNIFLFKRYTNASMSLKEKFVSLILLKKFDGSQNRGLHAIQISLKAAYN